MLGDVYFSGEDMLSALLLAMVIDHCTNPTDLTDSNLDSGGTPANADAMTALGEQGLIEITNQHGPRIVAKMLPEGRALLARLRLEQQRKAASSWRYPPVR